MSYVYPAFFRHTDSGGCSVAFPDHPSCISAGDTLEEAEKENINFSQVLQDALKERIKA
jgi:predicted RNase H-like HicB family nuclease